MCCYEPNGRRNDLPESLPCERRETPKTRWRWPRRSFFFRCNDEGVGTEHLRVAVFWQRWQLFPFPFLFFPPSLLPFFSRAETRPWRESSQNCCRFKDLPSNPLNATCGTILAKALEAKINYVSVPSEAQDGYSHKKREREREMPTSRYNQCNPGPSNISKDRDKHNTTLWMLSHPLFHRNACKIAIWKRKSSSNI